MNCRENHQYSIQHTHSQTITNTTKENGQGFSYHHKFLLEWPSDKLTKKAAFYIVAYRMITQRVHFSYILRFLLKLRRLIDRKAHFTAFLLATEKSPDKSLYRIHLIYLSSEHLYIWIWPNYNSLALYKINFTGTQYVLNNSLYILLWVTRWNCYTFYDDSVVSLAALPCGTIFFALFMRSNSAAASLLTAVPPRPAAAPVPLFLLSSELKKFASTPSLAAPPAPGFPPSTCRSKSSFSYFLQSWECCQQITRST